MPSLSRLSAVLGIVALVALGGAGAAQAVTAPTTAPGVRAVQGDLDDFEFESFHSDYVLTRDARGHANLRVVETIVAVFPEFDQNRGFYRDIPEYRHGVQLHTVVESVVDESGEPVPYSTEYYQDFYSVALGDDSFVHGRQTYVITYTQVDVIEAFDDTGADEFYWDVNGTGWAQTFDAVSMRLIVEPDLATELTGEFACYACDEPLEQVAQPDGSVEFTTSGVDLAPFESLTFAIAFQTGTFVAGEQVVPPPTDDPDCCDDEKPTFWDTTFPFILGPAGVILSFVAGATQVANRSRRTGPSDIIIPQYAPPKDLNVMVAAYIAGYPDKAFAAQLVDLAVRGNIRLLDNAPESRAPFEAEFLHGEGLDDLESKLLRAVFNDLTPGHRVSVDARSSGIGYRLPEVYRAVDKRLKDAGMQGPRRPTVLWSILFFLTIAIAVVAGFNALRSMAGGFAELSLIAAGVAIYAVFLTYGKRSTVATLSSRGRAVNDHLLGMRDYMELAEEDRIRMLQSPEGAERVTVRDDLGRIDVTDRRQMVKLYERLLPYAVIYGIEDRWAEVLTITAQEAQVPVAWYSGSSDFSAWRLNSTIKNLRRAAPEPPQPAVPRPVRTKSSGGGSSWGGWGSGSSSGGWSGSSGSSFSGGSRGGGFSGGGGGGGGGRGR